MDEEKNPYSLKEIFEEMELELIDSFYRNLIKHKKEESDLGFAWEMWQVAMLRNLETYRKETLHLINGYRKDIEDSIKEVLEKSYDKGAKDAEKVLSGIDLPKHGENIGPVNQKPPAEQNFFGVNKKKLNALIESTTNDFKEASKAIYRQTDDVYRQTIHKTEFQMSSGAISLGKAIDLATQDFLNKGIDCIIYKNGRHVNIATYAEMALRTASQRATFLGEGAKRDEYGIHLIVVSSHANACEMCLPWQGEILIDDVFSHPDEEYKAKYKQYKLLSTAIKAGLLHPNCRHTLFTYFEGVTKLPEKQDEKKALENYQLEQRQRKLEREIRKQKRIVKGTVDEQNRREETRKLRAFQNEMKQFIQENPQFKRNQSRERDILGPLTQQEKDDIMVSEIKSIIGKPKSEVHLTPRVIDTSSLSFDEKHINIERLHFVTKEEAISYIENADISVTVWDGKFERYYGKDGSAYVDMDSKMIRTSYKKEEYDDITKRLMEVLKKNEK